MDVTHMTALLRERCNLRIGTVTGEYLYRRLRETPPPACAIAVMGGDARTGLAVRTFVEPDLLSRIQS